LTKLRDSLAELKRYGVVLARSTYNDIANCIENNYLELTANEIDFMDTELTSAIIEDIFAMYCAYIKEENLPSVKVDGLGKELYPIPVELFDSYLAESDFSRFKSTDIRKAFRGLYTHTNAGRYDYYSAPCGEKTNKFKSIAFWKDKVDSME